MLDRRDNMSHITFDTLIDYVDNKLTSAESESVEIHLATNCESCQVDLTWLNETLSLMKTDDWVAPPSDLSRSVRQAFKKEYQPVVVGPSLLDRLREWLAPRPQVAWAAVAALVLVAVLFALQLGSGRTVEQDATASVTDGIALVLSADSESWEAIEEDSSFSSGDTIRTGEDSTVVLTYNDDSVTVIESNTELKIIEMSASSDGTQVTILAQSSGLTHHRVNSLTGEGSIYEVRTPAATINVIGTYFSVAVELNGDTDVAVEEGKVAVKGSSETVVVAAGQFTTVAMGGQPATATAIPSPTMTVAVDGEQSSGVTTPVAEPDATSASPADGTQTPTPISTPRDPTPTATDSESEEPTVTETTTPTPTASSTSTSEVATATGTPVPPDATHTPPPTNTDPPPPTATQAPPPTDTPPPPPTATPPPPPTNTPPPPPTDEPTPYPPPDGDTSEPPTETPPPPPTDESTPYPPPADDEDTSQSTSVPPTDDDSSEPAPPGQTISPPGQDNNSENAPPGQTRTPPGHDDG